MGNVPKFTSSRIERITGLKANTLHYYVQAGAVFPEISAGAGTGTTRLFSKDNVIECFIISKLISFGLPKRFILEFFESLRKSGEHELIRWEEISKNDGRDRIIAFSPDFPGQASICYHFLGLENGQFRLDRPVEMIINLTCIANLLNSFFDGSLEPLSETAEFKKEFRKKK